ncbi:MAG: translocation/assembly module TamB domain-containing protein, partial [Pseudomonadales bacterium]
ARRPWSVDAPVAVVVSDSGVDFTSFTMRAGAGSRLSLNGRLPLKGPGVLFLDVEALPAEDLAMLLQNEYLDVRGELDAELDLSGSAEAPAIIAVLEVRDAVFGDVRAPFLQGRFYYENQLLSGEVEAWRRGSQVLGLNLRLPVDLAIRGAERRQMEGPILVNTVADSVDLQLFDFVIPTIRWETGGALKADFTILGTWENPELSGYIEMLNGQTTLTGLGVTWTDLNGVLTLAGDSINIEHFSGRSGNGEARVTGVIRLEELSKPIVNVRIAAEQFHAVEVREFLSVTTTADLALRGPLLGATLTGEGTVTEGVLFFADLISKDVLNLEDTLYIRENLVDTLEIRRQRLGEQFENRFLDSLRIDSLRLKVGADVWLRSTEANIALDGELTVNKERDEYLLNGTLQSPRGTYRLSLGRSFGSFITRDFRVTRGQLMYFGTPDLNAGVDIDASHLVRTVRGENITVFVHIGGTLYDPELRFSSDIVPPISETEVLSYLLFGAQSAQAFATEGGAQGIGAGVTELLGALSGQLEYSLITNLGVPLDYFQISPQYAGANFSGTEIALGKRIGEKWFLTVSPRICSEAELIRNVGASIEYRFSREWLLSLSGDPVLSCTLGGTSTGRFNKYQVGFDIFWEKRY